MYTSLTWYNGLPVVTVRLGKTVLYNEAFQSLSEALVAYAERTTVDPNDDY